MDSTARLDEYIKASHYALLAISLLSIIAFLTAIDRIKLAHTIAKFDRYLIEYYVVSESRETPFTISEDIDDYSDEDLGISKLGTFAKLAHFRYALPEQFYRDICSEKGRYKKVESGWTISVSDDECRLYEKNFYKMPGDRKYSVKSPCTDEQKCFAMPPESGKYDGEDTEAFREDGFLKDLDSSHLQNENSEDEDGAYTPKCRQIAQLTPKEYGSCEYESRFQRMTYQVSGNLPAEIRLDLSHRDGLVGMKRDPIIVTNASLYMDTANGCNYAAGDFSIDTQTMPKAMNPKDDWDCAEQKANKLPQYIQDNLDSIIEDREGAGFSPDLKRNYKFYKGYLKSMENDFGREISLPVIDIKVSSYWIQYLSYAMVAFFLFWIDYILGQILQAKSLTPTTPWVNGVVGDYFSRTSRSEKIRSLALNVIPLLSGKFAAYLLPGVLIWILIPLEMVGNIPGTRQIHGVNIVFSFIAGLGCVVLGVIEIGKEMRIIRRIRSETVSP